MNEAKVLYELENGVVLRDGDTAIVKTNEGWEIPNAEYRGKVEVTPDAIWVLGENSLSVDHNSICIHFEFVEDVVKVGWLISAFKKTVLKGGDSMKNNMIKLVSTIFTIVGLVSAIVYVCIR